MKTLLFVPILFSLVACNATKTEEITSGGVVTSKTPHVWGSQSFPKTVYVSEDFDTAEVENINDMADKWDVASEGKKSFFLVQSTPVAEKSDTVASSDGFKDSIFGIYKVVKWPTDLPSALAVTQMFGTLYNSGASDEYFSIQHADILVNYRYTFYSGDSGYGYDLKTVILHEMGHFIGLNHQNVTYSQRYSTVMYPSVSSGDKKRDPTPLDQVTLASHYNYTLSSSSGSSQMVTPRKEYKPRDAGTEVKMQIELYPDGECVHRMNGKVVNRHPASLK
ncbi:matrixin family metalloprotease [Peredibacter starrii]|uniref:Matrixin family metalloprotease n=1 Tax=Peredibacter starrii TaxID=28202 RepID=A0AAX4HJH0_9BACT|nr:matrixin family metalloprotease [Peredibacter starrii]WPU63381.1 matrixin family metalloprotease [Peredibacter starrii]